MLNLIILVLGFAILGGTIFTKIFYNKKPNILIYLLSIVLILGSMSFSIIPTGYTGVKETFGQINPNTLPNGLNFKIPLIQSIQKVNNKQQDITFPDKVWSVTSENTNVFFENVVVTYQINPEQSAWIYSNISNYKENLVSRILVESALKAASVTLSTDKVPNRSLIEPLAKKSLQLAFDEKYQANTVLITAVNIGNVDFEEEYNAALEQKQLLQKQFETAQIENRKSIEKAQADAEVTQLAANAKAKARITEAEAEAKASQLLTETLNDKILINKYLNRWDGKKPLVVNSEGNLLNISSLIGN